MNAADRDLVDRYFEAMREGASAEQQLLGLFTDDAVYVEPFAGEPRTHRGRAAIRIAFRAGWESPPPDLKLHVDRIDVDEDRVFSEWTCTSPAFPHPIRGRDEYTMRDGKIARLEVTLAP